MERDEGAVREPVLEELGSWRATGSRELRDVGLDALVGRDELRARPCLSPGTSGCSGLDGLLGDRQVALALEVLADLVDVQLRAVLRVAAVKVLKEPLRLLVDFFCAVQRACLGRRPVRRTHDF